MLFGHQIRLALGNGSAEVVVAFSPTTSKTVVTTSLQAVVLLLFNTRDEVTVRYVVCLFGPFVCLSWRGERLGINAFTCCRTQRAGNPHGHRASSTQEHPWVHAIRQGFGGVAQGTRVQSH